MGSVAYVVEREREEQLLRVALSTVGEPAQLLVIPV